MPPIASMRSGKSAKLTTTTWLTSTPVYASTVWIASAVPPKANAPLILPRPWPGMSTIVSRAIDSRLFAPPPTRSSMIESDRPLAVCAPGSPVPSGRWSEPSTRTLLGDHSG